MSIKEQGMNLNESRFLQADKNNDENGKFKINSRFFQIYSYINN